MIETFVRALFSPYEGEYIEVRCFRCAHADIVHTSPQIYWFKLSQVLNDPLIMKQFADLALRVEAIGFDVYVGVLPRQIRDGSKKGIAQAGVVWVDLDFKTHTPDEARAQLRAKRPDIIVESGYGYHAYWYLSKGLYDVSGPSGKAFEGRVRSHQLSFGRVDPTADLPRILRVPGTTNFKDAENPRPVRLISPRPAPVAARLDMETSNAH